MKQLRTLSFLVVVVLVGCDKPQPVIVLDGWWNADYAKDICERAQAWHRENAALISQFGCDKVTSCPEMMPRVEACVHDPVQEVRTFEDKLATEFAANPDCSSVQFVHFESPGDKSKSASDALQKQHWFVGLDYIPGAWRQQWWMERSPDHSAHTQGEGNPNEIARKICAIVNQRGATIAN
jgi:hypothetical protein